jgi:hypothetical protein
MDFYFSEFIAIETMHKPPEYHKVGDVSYPSALSIILIYVGGFRVLVLDRDTLSRPLCRLNKTFWTGFTINSGIRSTTG